MLYYTGKLISDTVKETSKISKINDRVYEIHAAILEKIKAGDANGARTAMSMHLKEVAKGLIEANVLKKDKISKSEK